MNEKSPTPPRYNSADIVLAPFPFADHSITKLRPALIVSILPKEAYLVIYITSSKEDPTEYDVILNPSKTNNLKVVSTARVNRITVISNDMITNTLGSLSPKENSLIREKLALLQDNFSDC